jgi:thiol-disulfide isomerase/thioredoxin
MDTVARPAVARGLMLLAGLLLLTVPVHAAPLTGIALETFPQRTATSLEASKGRPVLLNFWAPWCVPCRLEFPELEALQARLKSAGVEVIGVTAEADDKKIQRFVASTGVTFGIVVDPRGALHRAVNLEAMPTTVLLDADGRLVKTYLGYSPGRGLADMERDARTLAGSR